ncbi:unnamed protein product [Didymodactylos carnosus]|uniref:NAD(P)(+)--arginine ADP-ribosyltransferase n=1 Tax=Didymodactylos carnosus TaxID=1234261 RepID=A0A814FXD5_9BILA|nr:unnamed protein product [Didymodactylos carnosus]CAF0988200.1 unnamed protein product [Didymodactylos carnosus]CAF3649939.1 unnamed protein product [Didymodactylos carnosus]CAF3760361.1 unnamed protein product [Didymodactylos carnosus]
MEPSRFYYENNEPTYQTLPTSLLALKDQPLLTLEAATAPLADLFTNLEQYVRRSKTACQDKIGLLTLDEAASIYLYTLTFKPPPSLYSLLNATLRIKDDQHHRDEELEKWLLYLKLYITALNKLPSEVKTVYRAIKDTGFNIADYAPGTEFRWWSFTSSSVAVDSLKPFLGPSGHRTFFSIDCKTGKSIMDYSHYPDAEKEVILLPATKLQVIGYLPAGNDLYLIQLKETEASPFIDRKPVQNLYNDHFLKPCEFNFEILENVKPPMAGNVKVPQGFIRHHRVKLIAGVILTLCIICRINRDRCNTSSHAKCEPFLQPSLSQSTCTKPSWKKQAVTVAGTTGKWGSSSTQLYTPAGIFIDPNGYSLYVADMWNYRIQKFVQGSNTGITVAGGHGQGDASNQLNSPSDVFVDSSGNLFIANAKANRIQMWKPNSSEGVTVLRTNGNAAAIAQSKMKKEDFYITTYDGELIKYSSPDSTVKVIGTSINNGAGIYVDKCDNVYAADYGGGKIERFAHVSQTTTGEIIENNLSAPTDVLADPYGNLYIVEQGRHVVHRWSVKSQAPEVIAGIRGEMGTDAEHLFQPWSLDFDSKYNLYVSDKAHS